MYIYMVAEGNYTCTDSGSLHGARLRIKELCASCSRPLGL